MMISTRDLGFTYPGNPAPTLRGITLEVAEGEILGILGPSGAGKSTLQNLLIGLLRGWSGEVAVLGRPLESWGRDYYRSIGVSFELPNHFEKLTARENLGFFAAMYGGGDVATPEEVMDAVGLDPKTHLDRRAGDFSKGMKNRLGVARSLLHRPRLWFLDEPTAGLDPVNAARIRDLVRAQQAAGVTTLLTTHDMAIADALCDRVAFIVDGEVVECDAPEALRRRYGRAMVAVTWEEPDGTGGTDEFPLAGLADDDGFRQALRHPGLRTIHSQETTLGDVFVQVTGRRLR